MSVSYKSHGDSPTAACMNALFAAADTKLQTMLSGGKSFLLGLPMAGSLLCRQHESVRLKGRGYLFFNGTNDGTSHPYLTAYTPDWLDGMTSSQSEIPFDNAVREQVALNTPPQLPWLSLDESVGVAKIKPVVNDGALGIDTADGRLGYFDGSLEAWRIKMPVVEFVMGYGGVHVQPNTFHHVSLIQPHGFFVFDQQPANFYAGPEGPNGSGGTHATNRIRLPHTMTQADVEAVVWEVHWTTAARELSGDPSYSLTFTLAGKLGSAPEGLAYRVYLSDAGVATYDAAEPDGDWWIWEQSRACDPERRNRYGLAEIVVVDKALIVLPPNNFKFCCYRVHNLQSQALTVFIGNIGDPGSQSFTVPKFGSKCLRYVPNARIEFTVAYDGPAGFLTSVAPHGLVDGDEVWFYATRIPLGMPANSYGRRFFVSGTATYGVALAETSGGATWFLLSDGAGIQLEKVAQWTESSMAYFQEFVAGDPMVYWWPRTNQDDPLIRSFIRTDDPNANEFGLGDSANPQAAQMVSNTPHANNLTNPAILLDWLEIFSRECDPGANGFSNSASIRKNCLLFADVHERCDMAALGLTGGYGDPASDATLIADLFFHKGRIKLDITEAATGEITTDYLYFKGFSTIVADFAAKHVIVEIPGGLPILGLQAVSETGWSITMTQQGTNLLGTNDPVNIDGGYALPVREIFEWVGKYFRQSVKAQTPEHCVRHKTLSPCASEAFTDQATQPTVDKGAWDATANYVRGDIVKWHGVKYLCLNDVEGSDDGLNGQPWPLPQFRAEPLVEDVAGGPLAFNEFFTFRYKGTPDSLTVTRDSDDEVMTAGGGGGDGYILSYLGGGVYRLQVRYELEDEAFTIHITHASVTEADPGGLSAGFTGDGFWHGFKAEDAWDSGGSYVADDVVVSGCAIFGFNGDGDSADEPWDNWTIPLSLETHGSGGWDMVCYRNPGGSSNTLGLTEPSPTLWPNIDDSATSGLEMGPSPPADPASSETYVGSGVHTARLAFSPFEQAYWMPPLPTVHGWPIYTYRPVLGYDSLQVSEVEQDPAGYAYFWVGQFPPGFGVENYYTDATGIKGSTPTAPVVSARASEALFTRDFDGSDLTDAYGGSTPSVIGPRSIGDIAWTNNGKSLNYESGGFDLQGDGVLSVDELATTAARTDTGNSLVLTIAQTTMDDFQPLSHTVADLKSLVLFCDPGSGLASTYSQFTNLSLKFTPQGPVLMFIERVKAEAQAISSDCSNQGWTQYAIVTPPGVRTFLPGSPDVAPNDSYYRLHAPENSWGELRHLNGNGPDPSYGTSGSDAGYTAPTLRAWYGETLHQGEYELSGGGWIQRKRVILFRGNGFGMRNDKWENPADSVDIPRNMTVRHSEVLTYGYGTPIAPMPCVDQPVGTDGGEDAFAYARSLTCSSRYGERIWVTHPISGINGVVHGDDFVVIAPRLKSKRAIQRRIPISETALAGNIRGWWLPYLAPLLADHYNLMAEAVNAVYAVRPLGIETYRFHWTDIGHFSLGDVQQVQARPEYSPLALFCNVPASGPYRDWIDGLPLAIKTDANFPASFATALAAVPETSSASMGTDGVDPWTEELDVPGTAGNIVLPGGVCDLNVLTGLEWLSLDDIKTWADGYGIPLFYEEAIVPFTLEHVDAPADFAAGAFTTASGTPYPYSRGQSISALTSTWAFVPDHAGAAEWKYVPLTTGPHPRVLPDLVNFDSADGAAHCMSYMVSGGVRQIGTHAAPEGYPLYGVQVPTYWATNVDEYTSVEFALNAGRVLLDRMARQEISSIGFILISPSGGTKRMLAVPEWYSKIDGQEFYSGATRYAANWQYDGSFLSGGYYHFNSNLTRTPPSESREVTGASSSTVAGGYHALNPGTGRFRVHQTGSRIPI